MFNFRKKLNQLKEEEADQKFRKTVNQPNRLLLSFSGTKLSKGKKIKAEKEENEFYTNLDKVM